MIILNPCYNESDVFKAMYKLVGEEPPIKIWQMADKEKDLTKIEKDIAAAKKLAVHTDRAEAEKSSAKELFGN